MSVRRKSAGEIGVAVLLVAIALAFVILPMAWFVAVYSTCGW
jgi:hypothetical protein